MDTALDSIEQTSPVSANAFSYDPVTETYSFVWRTTKAQGCYRLVLRLADDQEFTADFLLR